MAPCPQALCAHSSNAFAPHRRAFRPDAAFGKYRDARQQLPETRKPCPFRAVQQSRRRRRVLAAETGQLGAADLPPEEPQPSYSVQVFPRIRERDPYRLLGVERAATFEEVQDARNYLYEEYRGHGRSREAIEMAFDEILKIKMQKRHKFGFQPPKSGRSTDLQGDPPRLTLWEKWQGMLEPSVSRETIVNDGFIFSVLSLWFAYSTLEGSPGMPTFGIFAFAIYCIWAKRRKRRPEGPFLGNNPLFGAVLITLAAFVVMFAAMAVLGNFTPAKASVPYAIAFFFFAGLIPGAAAIFVK